MMVVDQIRRRQTEAINIGAAVEELEWVRQQVYQQLNGQEKKLSYGPLLQVTPAVAVILRRSLNPRKMDACARAWVL
jgi:hypothetical protein